MFIALFYVYCILAYVIALFTIAKLWKQPKCLLIDEWIKTHTHTHTHTHTQREEYYSAIKKNEILPFAMMWMELECNAK